ncbi:hypothetical protein AVEN_267246-1 [Araneus ventricosus]|uniref:Uncharacterized protein n=1 Tax=Araneus ventricosus TaxID=182803 RepID=A0A4Y2W5H6_ARAVE|nr:hypothetical protein AVEN_110577-1 [Araneus ventricosus]GBO31381.1 hypothetical protein AVEN_123044-1 [Araneus ventricosus]GBO31382.1 hypothetical protein AVEN_210775-1 [Araneus ventricosus]GBO31383.1 hypothetical protein AVEN_267246-1 [Araneus ventricosus]
MQIQQLLHWCFNVRRSTILHKNFAVHTSPLLHCWNELVAQKRFIKCLIGCSGYRTRRTNLLQKEKVNNKCCRKPSPHSDLLRMKRQWLHLERIVCPQNVPWPCIVHFHSSRKLQSESVSFWQEPTPEYA